MKSLVAYFSAEFGATKKLAEQLASAASADIFEIRPEKPYTKADLKYINPLLSRSLRAAEVCDRPILRCGLSEQAGET